MAATSGIVVAHCQKWNKRKFDARQNEKLNHTTNARNNTHYREKLSLSNMEESMRSFRHIAADDDNILLFAADIADCISSELTTIGLIAALLSSWGATIYGGDPPPEGGLCYGADMLRTAHVLFWISLGWFFISVTSSLVIAADLHGIPRRLILEHLKNPNVRLIYQIPEISIIVGVVFLAAGYTCDFGERTGCAFLYIGMVAAPSFVGAIGLLIYVLRQDRRRLNKHLDTNEKCDEEPLGRSIIATWRDRLYAASENIDIGQDGNDSYASGSSL